jgi:cytochrome b6-f complex iron-sulfur subunit
MARKSVKEILEAARKGGPVSSGADQPPGGTAPETPAEETGETAPAPAPAAAKPAAPRATAPAAPAASGRPLSLKEKLAAARTGAGAGAVAVAAPPPPPPPPPPPAEAEEPNEAAAAPTSPPADPGRLLTLKEKMAAARAQAASAGSAPAAAKPGAAAAAPAKAAPKRALPPLAEITDPKDLAEALRQAGAKKEAEVAAAARLKEPPAKPAREKESRPQTVLPRPSKTGATATAPAPAAGTELRRRRFLFFTGFSMIWIGWGSFLAGVGAFTAMLGRFMFPNVLAEPPSTVKVGVKTNYDPDSVNERFKAEGGFWIVRSTRYDGQDIIYALKSVCTHLGCPPNWLEGEQKFKCPCHGSGFYISGVNFEGPAPRPLERYKVTLADDGQIVVDKSQIFQQERDQWTDPDSFITV